MRRPRNDYVAVGAAWGGLVHEWPHATHWNVFTLCARLANSSQPACGAVRRGHDGRMGGAVLDMRGRAG